jgi:hypothetical protein
MNKSFHLNSKLKDWGWPHATMHEHAKVDGMVMMV